MCLLATALLLITAGCTESDDVLVSEIGVTRILLADPDARAQNVFDPETPYQVVEWSLSAATLELNGQFYDLLFENDFDAAVADEQDDENDGDPDTGDGDPPPSAPCRFIDSVVSIPAVNGPCGAGLVIDGGEQTQSARLIVEVASMQLRRGEPAPLIVGRDFDGDGIPEGPSPCTGGSTFGCDDNCPVLFNPDQEDPDANGIGSRCTGFDPFSGLVFVDSDADGFGDGADNCVWIQNVEVDPVTGRLFQPDTTGTTLDGVVDLIGDACVEEIAVVEVAGSGSFRLEFDASEFVQTRNGVSLLTVDFNGLTSLDCDWDVGRCELDPSAVEFCVRTSASGC